MTFNEYLDFLADTTRWTPATNQRRGQFMFNRLTTYDRALAVEITATDVDPFYLDTRIRAFLAYVQEHVAQHDARPVAPATD